VRACVFLRRRFWMTLTLTLTLAWTLTPTLILTTLSLALRNLSLTLTSRTLSVRMCAAETWWGVGERWVGVGCVVYRESASGVDEATAGADNGRQRQEWVSSRGDQDDKVPGRRCADAVGRGRRKDRLG
jgi:hypothetical protein